VESNFSAGRPLGGGTAATEGAAASASGGVRTRTGGLGGGLRFLRVLGGSVTSELALRRAFRGLRLRRSFVLAMSTVSLPSPKVDHQPSMRLSVAIGKN